MQQPEQQKPPQVAEAAPEAELVGTKYLLFTLGQETYGVELLHIREVIKMPAIKPVPHMVSCFKGMINLRGQIVGIVDLRAKFSIPVKSQADGLVLIVETPGSLIGAVVDSILSVEEIFASSVDADPAVETRIPARFFKGVAKLNERLVNLVDVSGCLASDNFRTARQSA